MLHNIKKLVTRLHRRVNRRLEYSFHGLIQRRALKLMAETNGTIPPKAPGELRFLSLKEPASRLEILRLKNHYNDVSLYFIPVGLFKSYWTDIFSQYIGTIDKSLGEFSNETYLSNKHASSRATFITIATSVFEALVKKHHFDLVILPKYNDDWLLDIGQALNAVGLPIVIDDREGGTSPIRLETMPERFRASHVYDFELLNTHNNYHRELFIRSGVPSEKVSAFGAPQSDFFFSPELWKPRRCIHPDLEENKLLLLFFSFGAKTGLNIYFPHDQRSWLPLLDDYHDVLLHVLQNHSDTVQIVYKAGGKPLRDYYPGFPEFYEKAKPYISPSTFLPLNSEYSSPQLVKSSDIVLAFYTTGILEAMLTDASILLGGWGSLFEDVKDKLIPYYSSGGIQYARSKEMMKLKLDEIISDKSKRTVSGDDRHQRHVFLNEYFANADGSVSHRLLTASRNIAKGLPYNHKG